MFPTSLPAPVNRSNIVIANDKSREEDDACDLDDDESSQSFRAGQNGTGAKARLSVKEPDMFNS